MCGIVHNFHWARSFGAAGVLLVLSPGIIYIVYISTAVFVAYHNLESHYRMVIS